MLKNLLEHINLMWRWIKIPQRRRSLDRRPRHYRLELVSESSLSTLHSLRVSRPKLIVLTIAVVVGFITMVMMLFSVTPLGRLLPGRSASQMRKDFVTLSHRADSLENLARINDAYVDNILSILNDDVQTVDSALMKATRPVSAIPVDSLIPTSELQRQFVENYEKASSYNLSVLTPIAAEAMLFYPPVTGFDVTDTENGISVSSHGIIPVSAIYRGTVLAVSYDSGQGYTVIIQHPNEFLSVYYGLSEVFVSKGKKVEAGSRIGMTNGKFHTLTFDLWHSGLPVHPRTYISF